MVYFLDRSSQQESTEGNIYTTVNSFEGILKCVENKEKVRFSSGKKNKEVEVLDQSEEINLGEEFDCELCEGENDRESESDNGSDTEGDSGN
ncbi:MAG: hypothetical protein QF915_00115, partial [Candidatus Woesearchaeota archaeon]|nr:hypothetical protein [Candidatus Woesearchaeota archaeon]